MTLKLSDGYRRYAKQCAEDARKLFNFTQELYLKGLEDLGGKDWRGHKNLLDLIVSLEEQLEALVRDELGFGSADRKAFSRLLSGARKTALTGMPFTLAKATAHTDCVEINRMAMRMQGGATEDNLRQAYRQRMKDKKRESYTVNRSEYFLIRKPTPGQSPDEYASQFVRDLVALLNETQLAEIMNKSDLHMLPHVLEVIVPIRKAA